MTDDFIVQEPFTRKRQTAPHKLRYRKVMHWISTLFKQVNYSLKVLK